MAIVVSILVAFVLALLPLPNWATIYRPDWVALVLIYWALAVPHRVGAGVGWVVGLFVDVVNANLLGVHALGLTLVGYLTNRFHLRVRMFPWWQQAVAVLILLVLYRGTVGWLRGFSGPMELDAGYWVPCAMGMLVWPWVFVLLRDLRRAARVH